MTINQPIKELEELIEKHIFNAYKLSLDSSYKVTFKNPSVFLLSSRFDLIIKINYVKSLIHSDNNYITEKIYKEHIKALSLGSFKEPGGSKKSYNDYKQSLLSLIESIQRSSFDFNKSIIPVGKNNTLLDGSHRVAISYLLNIPIPTIEFDVNPGIYDLKFFHSRQMDYSYLLHSVYLFVRNNVDLRLALLWPQGDPVNSEYIINELLINELNPIYDEVYLPSFKFLHHLIVHSYFFQPEFIGEPPKFRGALYKAAEVYKPNTQMRILLFDASGKDTLKLKESYRTKVGINHSSLHISDNKEDTRILASFLFNQNSRIYSDYIKVSNSTYKKMKLHKDYFNKKKGDLDQTLLVGSAILGLLGIREPRDLDVFSINNEFDSIIENNHNVVSVYYPHDKFKLVLDPKNFFFIYGIKILSPENTIHFKENRDEVKDRSDIIRLKRLNLPMQEYGYKVSIKKIITFKMIKITYRTKVVTLKILKKTRLTWIVNVIKRTKGRKRQ